MIPNKIFQAMAMAKPVITRAASSYPCQVSESDAIGWVKPGSSESLAEMVRKWVLSPEMLVERGKKARKLYDDFFETIVLEKQLCEIIAAAFVNWRKGI